MEKVHIANMWCRICDTLPDMAVGDVNNHLVYEVYITVFT